ncbi:MAG: gamma-glutamyl-gamma-aminobutyrate hydrolase family protein [Cyanobacteria bacterium SZAS LIN-3]|nr:gamma-glutamyl-gamma-aminobutyrate hydrolase family protein [Cyanobacteria bacterium SZAS LIN-3]
MKPLIGINLDIKPGPPEEAKIQTTYTDAIVKSGGIPVLLPPMPAEDLAYVMQRLDGVMLIGGLDYCPSLYKEAPDATVELTSGRRQEFDLNILRETLKQANMPLLGVCAGAQLLNIELGGSLVQDIKTSFSDSSVEHSSVDGWKTGYNKHDVILSKDSVIAGVYGRERFAVPTSHHQSVKDLGRGLKVTALADDGVIEAIELENSAFVVGVQWHPERDYETNKPLFDRLISAARERRGATPAASGVQNSAQMPGGGRK